MIEALVSRRLFSVILATSTLAVAGCAATGTAFERVASVPSGKALIYIYRDTSMMGAALTPDVSINGGPKFALQRGSYFPYLAEPGKVSIVLTNVGKNTKEIDAVAGATYYVKGGLVPMGFGVPFVMNAKPDIAEQELKDCKLIAIAPPANK